MTQTKMLHGMHAALWAALLMLIVPEGVLSQPKVLDDFESLDGWRAITSDGALLHLQSVPGKSGNALEMDFDLSKVSGYVIAQKDFSIELPEDYQFSFDLRADAPVNNFEFKLLDDSGNVFWQKKLNMRYPAIWTRQRIRKRDISYAWGPARGGEARSVRKIEFVVSCGTGGVGKVFIDNFRFAPIDVDAARRATAEILPPGEGTIVRDGSLLERWKPAAPGDSLSVDFHYAKEIGGFVLRWDSTAFAASYHIELSDDGNAWTTVYTVAHGNGGRDYLSTPGAEGRFLRLVIDSSAWRKTPELRTMAIQGPEFSSSPNTLFRTIAGEAPRGYYPRYFRNEQSYWTVFGVNGDDKEALMSDQGTVEVDKGSFTIEPFLYVDGKLVTWSDVRATPELYDRILPMPSVFWDYNGEWRLQVEGCAAGVPGNSLFAVRYSVQTKIPNARARLFLAIRPFQVNPPWQNITMEGGIARIDSIAYTRGLVLVNGKEVVPMTAPSGFGAATFDEGDVTEYAAQGILPPFTSVHDRSGYASAALAYDMKLDPEQTFDVEIAVPFHGWRGSPRPDIGGGGAGTYFDLMERAVAQQWQNSLGTFSITLPPSAGPIANTIKSNLAYILVNRDGPAIQPGSRCYDRSWIRDGALTCEALLRVGMTKEVREFVEWYARGQYPNGKIPCVIDSRGPDAVPENDSQGEFLYAVRQYFEFSKDTTWLKGMWWHVSRTVSYIQSLIAQRRTEKYLHGTSEERALYGLVPESISHEGYSDVPRHSYWDDFFTLRGLKDAAAMALALGKTDTAKLYAAERDRFRHDLYASMRLAMKNTHIDYIPGCAELGDFDATSTTIGLDPCGELGNIPEPQLRNTFDRYYAFFKERETKNTYLDYTPYETRIIGSFVRLGQKKRAEEAVKFFMKDRRPPEWNEWAEVVWRDPLTPKYVGDMPHTWVGSDFIRSILSMFVYERERDASHVLAAGIPDAWIHDSAGVSVEGLRTYYGTIGYTVRNQGRSVSISVGGSFDAGHHRLVLAYPLSGTPRSVLVNGRQVRVSGQRELLLRRLPSNVTFRY
jgi:hypothetical protein